MLTLLSLLPPKSVPHHDVFKANHNALHQQCFQCLQWAVAICEHTLTICSIGRCDLQGQLWSPGCAHGYGPNRSRSLQQVHEVQPKEPTLGQPRPLRSLVRLSLHTRLPKRWKRAFSWHWLISPYKMRSTEMPHQNLRRPLHTDMLSDADFDTATVTDACSNMPSTTCTATTSALTTSRSSVYVLIARPTSFESDILRSSLTASHQVTQSATTPQVLRSPLVLLVRASPTPLVLPLLRDTPPPPSTSQVSSSSTTSPTPSSVTVALWRVLPPRPLPWLVT